MVMLTEEMVIARTRQSNLEAVTKLNCWGSQLTDVSILRRMSNVVVLSLSVNNIDTLVDFQYCKMLQDLFVRKNDIKDLNEVYYLRNLQYLKCLWLDENPCANSAGYRLAVLKTLPRLTKLDDINVESQEVMAAQSEGRILVHPEDQGEYYSDPDEGEYEPNVREVESQPVIEDEPPRHMNFNDRDSTAQYKREREINQETERNSYNDSTQYSQMDNHTENGSSNRLYRYEDKPERIESHHYNSIPRSRTQPNVQSDGESPYGSSEWKRRTCAGSTCCIQSTFKRPNERRTNVLNAVLCLIKELDYPNLEVVQMAVKCRMEELSDEL